MKKIFFALLFIAAAFLAIAYIFIPRDLKITSVADGSANINAAYRHLQNDKNWETWWPGPEPFRYKGIEFRLDKKLLNRFEMRLFFKSDTLKNTLHLIPLTLDSTSYAWTCELQTGKNPVEKWAQYMDATQIKRILDIITDSLRSYLDHEENLYGFSVQETKVTDSVLISTKNKFDHYPDNDEIELMVQKLRNYINTEKAIEKNHPMLNVHQVGPRNYEAMVAIAVERHLPESKDFSPKRVLKGGNLLVAEFKGGPIATRMAFDVFEIYRVDHKFISPAIPYQLMITDRSKEKDTARWITKFCYPVFYKAKGYAQ